MSVETYVFKLGEDTYSKLCILGRGAQGEVWKVKRMKDQQIFAVKQICLAGMKTQDRAASLQTAELLCQCEHFNLVKYYQAIVQEQYLLILMEYIDGEDLQAKTKALSSPMAEELVWDYLIQISQGLFYLHQRKLIHRDVKQSNILVSSAGEVKVVDICLCQAAVDGRSSLGVGGIVAGTGVVGTIAYHAPEIIRSLNYDSKVDVWSLGCLLYELCALRQAFSVAPFPIMIERILTDQPADLSPTSYSQELRFLISKMFSKDQSKRPSIQDILRFSCVQLRIERAVVLRDQLRAVAKFHAVDALLAQYGTLAPWLAKTQQSQQSQSAMKQNSTQTDSESCADPASLDLQREKLERICQLLGVDWQKLLKCSDFSPSGLRECFGDRKDASTQVSGVLTSDSEPAVDNVECTIVPIESLTSEIQLSTTTPIRQDVPVPQTASPSFLEYSHHYSPVSMILKPEDVLEKEHHSEAVDDRMGEQMEGVNTSILADVFPLLPVQSVSEAKGVVEKQPGIEEFEGNPTEFPNGLSVVTRANSAVDDVVIADNQADLVDDVPYPESSESICQYQSLSSPTIQASSIIASTSSSSTACRKLLFPVDPTHYSPVVSCEKSQLLELGSFILPKLENSTAEFSPSQDLPTAKQESVSPSKTQDCPQQTDHESDDAKSSPEVKPNCGELNTSQYFIHPPSCYPTEELPQTKTTPVKRTTPIERLKEEETLKTVLSADTRNFAIIASPERSRLRSQSRGRTQEALQQTYSQITHLQAENQLHSLRSNNSPVGSRRNSAPSQLLPSSVDAATALPDSQQICSPQPVSAEFSASAPPTEVDKSSAISRASLLGSLEFKMKSLLDMFSSNLEEGSLPQPVEKARAVDQMRTTNITGAQIGKQGWNANDSETKSGPSGHFREGSQRPLRRSSLTSQSDATLNQYLQQHLHVIESCFTARTSTAVSTLDQSPAVPKPGSKRRSNSCLTTMPCQRAQQQQQQQYQQLMRQRDERSVRGNAVAAPPPSDAANRVLNQSFTTLSTTRRSAALAKKPIRVQQQVFNSTALMAHNRKDLKKALPKPAATSQAKGAPISESTIKPSQETSKSVPLRPRQELFNNFSQSPKDISSELPSELWTDTEETSLDESGIGLNSSSLMAQFGPKISTLQRLRNRYAYDH